MGLGVSLGPFEGWGRGTDTLCPPVWGGTPVHRPCTGSYPASPLCWSLQRRWAVGSRSERYLQNGEDSRVDDVRGLSAWVKSAVPSGIIWRGTKQLHGYEYMKEVVVIKLNQKYNFYCHCHCFLHAALILLFANKLNEPLFPSHWSG